MNQGSSPAFFEAGRAPALVRTEATLGFIHPGGTIASHSLDEASGCTAGSAVYLRPMKKAAKAKDDADAPPAPTKGVLMARANRTKCNNLTDKQRAALMAQAMVMIYGDAAEKASTRRR